MIRIESNIRGVITRLERLPKDVDSAVRRALNKDRWKPVFVRVAELTLGTLANADQRQFIPAFIQTITAININDKLWATMTRPGTGEDETVAEAIEIMENLKTRDYGDVTRLRHKPMAASADEQTVLNRVLEEIDRWVEEEKRLTSEEAANLDSVKWRIRHILLDPAYILRPPHMLDGAPSFKGVPGAQPVRTPEDALANRASLAAVLQEFISRQNRTAAAALDVETIDVWLSAALSAWLDKVLDEIGPVIVQELRRETTGQMALPV